MHIIPSQPFYQDINLNAFPGRDFIANKDYILVANDIERARAEGEIIF